MNNKRLLALFGLKWNPFLPNIPVQSLWPSPGVDTFLFQIENLVMDGGFALMGGEPGLGKSKNLQYLAHKLERLENVVVGVMERPQSSLADFYREMGDLFGVNLTPSNRYGGFKALRERWRQHIKATLFRPVLLIDEAQEIEVSQERLKVLHATMRTVQDIVNNFLGNIKLFRLKAEKANALEPEVLAKMDSIIKDTAEKIKKLGDLNETPEKQMAGGIRIDYERSSSQENTQQSHPADSAPQHR